MMYLDNVLQTFCKFLHEADNKGSTGHLLVGFTFLHVSVAAPVMFVGVRVILTGLAACTKNRITTKIMFGHGVTYSYHVVK